MYSIQPKKRFVPPTAEPFGNVVDITSGSRLLFEDAFIGASGTDGLIGPKCDHVKERFGRDLFACGS